jgi:hypothetical protein
MFPNRNCEGKLYLTTTTGGLSYGKDMYQKIESIEGDSDGNITIKGITYLPTTYPIPAVWKEWKSPFDVDPELITFDLPKKYIINDKVCVLVWEDGKITKIKKSPDDDYDPVKAFLWAWFQHTCSLPKWKANKYLAEVEENCINNITKKKPKKKKTVIEEI